MNRTSFGPWGVVLVSIFACALAGCVANTGDEDERTDEPEKSAQDYGACLTNYENCVSSCYATHGGDGKLGTCNTGCETIRELCAEKAPVRPPGGGGPR
jgi:hypothetical protein